MRVSVKRSYVAGHWLAQLALSCLALTALCGCYVLKQAYYQNNLINGRQLVSAVSADPKTPVEVRAALAQTQKIMAFAQVAGLNTQGAYEYYIDTPEPVASYLVFAAYADRLESKTWWFPVVGSVPYLGFFARADRDSEAAKLRDAGYDVHESAAAAFSSLGWFDDPLYKPMLLRKKQRDMAHLLLHELTHRTLWIAGSVEFNEALAEYVADVLTKDYLRAHGLDEDIREMELEAKDEATFKRWLSELREALSSIYQRGLPPAELASIKAATFARYLTEKLPIFTSMAYKNIATKAWNNATVLSYSLYAPDLERFARAHRCLGDVPIKSFLKKIGQVSVRFKSGYLALDSLCAA